MVFSMPISDIGKVHYDNIV